MSQVHRSHGPSSRGFHTDRVMRPGGGDLFSDNLCGLGPATSGPRSGARHHDCSTGAGSQQSASIASQLLGLVADAKTPEDKAALISAAISVLKSGTSHDSHHGSDKLLKILGGLAHQISTSSGLIDSAKGQILDGIAKLVKQIVSSANRQHSTSNDILNTLNQLINRISHATGLDQATKNKILDELAAIVQQFTQSGPASSGCSDAGSNACDVSNDNAAASGSGDLDAA
jgi:hypothetical protein